MTELIQTADRTEQAEVLSGQQEDEKVQTERESEQKSNTEHAQITQNRLLQNYPGGMDSTGQLPNITAIMNESFTDFTSVGGFRHRSRCCFY